jgi:cytochrome b561
MSESVASLPDLRHARGTRLIHAGLAATIILQLATSLVMGGPDEVMPGDTLFQVHRLSGFAAMAFAFLFWVALLVRRRGTEIGALLPWFSNRRRAALAGDILAHLRAALKFRLPPFEEDGALASAAHGLGLLLMTAMAATGTTYALLVWAGLHSAEPDGMAVMAIHFALGNLVWAYLIGHAALATLHHVMKSAPISRMWSFTR